MRSPSLIAFLLIARSLNAGPYDTLIVRGGSAAQYPGSGFVVLFDSTSVQVETSGLSHVITHKLIKVLTAEGAKTLAAQHFDYDPASASSQVKSATIYRGDGSSETLGPERILDQPQPARAIYWGARQILLDVGRLEPGDALETVVYRKGFTYALLQADEDERYVPPMRGQFYDIVPYYSHEPIVTKVYKVCIAADKNLKYKVFNGDIATTDTTIDNVQTLIFTKKDLRPYKLEPRAVDISDVGCKLLLSTSPDWEAKSRWFYQVNEDYKSFEANADIVSKMQEIVKGALNEFDSVNRLTHWVSDEIRYLGLSMGKGEGYTLHKASVDFGDRLGVCKDKAGMLISLLRAAGFEAYPAMTMAGSRIEDIPADQFNHCVTVMKSRRDGALHLLDPTWVPFTREVWSSAEQQQGYLMGLPEGADLAETPLADASRNYLRMSGMSYLLPDGTLEGEYTLTAEGQMDAAVRGLFTRSLRSRWEANLEREVLAVAPQAQLIQVYYPEPYHYLDAPIQIHFKIRIPDYGRVVGDKMIFKPFLANGFMNRAMPHLAFDTKLAERKQPFRDRTSHSLEISETFRFDHECQLIDAPANGTNQGGGAEYYTLLKGDGNMLRLVFNVTYPKRIYQPDDWPSYRQAVEAQNRWAKQPIVVQF